MIGGSQQTSSRDVFRDGIFRAKLQPDTRQETKKTWRSKSQTKTLSWLREKPVIHLFLDINPEVYYYVPVSATYTLPLVFVARQRDLWTSTRWSRLPPAKIRYFPR